MASIATRTTRRWSEQAAAWREGGLQWLIWLVVIALILGPILPTIYASIVDRPLYEDGAKLSLGSYQALFSDGAFWAATRNTALFALFAAVPAVIVGSALAVLVTRTSVPFRRTITAMMILPILFPGLGITLGWVSMYSPSGYVSTFVNDTLGFVPWNLYSIPGMAFVAIDKTVPLVYFFMRTRLMSMDSSIEDAARSAGARSWRVLRDITVPMTRPAVITSTILITMLAFESLGIPLILGTPADIETISTYLYNNWTQVPGSQGLVSAAASLLLLLVTIAFALRAILDKNQSRYVTVSGKPRPRKPLELGAVGWVFAGLSFVYLFVAVVIPVAGLVMTASTTVFTPLISPLDVLTTQNFEAVFSTPTFSRSLMNSLIISVIGAALSTILIGAAVLVAHRSRFRLRGVLPPMMLYPRAMPGIVVGVGFFWAFILIPPIGPLRTTIWGIMIAFMVRNLAVGYAAIQPTVQSLGQELDLAARSCGASWAQSARTIAIPLLRPALAGCFVLTFVSLLNDYDPAVFLTTSGNEVIGVTMLQQWLLGFPGPVAALGILQMIMTIAVLGIGRLLFGVKAHA